MNFFFLLRLNLFEYLISYVAIITFKKKLITVR